MKPFLLLVGLIFAAVMTFFSGLLPYTLVYDEESLMDLSIVGDKPVSAEVVTCNRAMACRQLHDVPTLVLLTCKARVALASGNHQMAFGRLNGILTVAGMQGLPSDVLAWSYSVAGDLAVAAGEPQQAMEAYQQSLGLAERTQVRAAFVDVLLNEKRYEDAWQTLDGGALALPLLVRRLIVARQLDRMDKLESMLAKVQREFEAWIDNEDCLDSSGRRNTVVSEQL